MQVQQLQNFSSRSSLFFLHPRFTSEATDRLTTTECNSGAFNNHRGAIKVEMKNYLSFKPINSLVAYHLIKIAWMNRAGNENIQIKALDDFLSSSASFCWKLLQRREGDRELQNIARNITSRILLALSKTFVEGAISSPRDTKLLMEMLCSRARCFLFVVFTYVSMFWHSPRVNKF